MLHFSYASGLVISLAGVFFWHAAGGPLPWLLGSAAAIVLAAVEADWAPISHEGHLHDRASYRYFWQVLERAHQTGCKMPDSVRSYFEPMAH